MWQRIWTLIVKELLAVWRDPKSRTILIVPPLIQMLRVHVRRHQEVKNVRIAVLNRDYGTECARPGRAVRGLADFHRDSIICTTRSDIAAAIDSPAVADGAAHSAPISRARWLAGRPASVQLILDGRRSNAAQIVAGYATAIVDAIQRTNWLATAHAAAPPSVVAARIWFNPNSDGTWNTVPSLVAILTT